MLKKSEFLERLQMAVEEARSILSRCHTHSAWQAAVLAGNKAGFKINPNCVESEDKILVAIRGMIGRSQNDSICLPKMILIEHAWEFYQEKLDHEHAVAGHPHGYGHEV